jgi:hypothetical protein
MCDCQKNNNNQFNSFYNQYTDGTYANADGTGLDFLEGFVDTFTGSGNQNQGMQTPPPNMGMQTPPPPPTQTFWQRNGLMIIGFGVLGAVITGILIFKGKRQ